MRSSDSDNFQLTALSLMRGARCSIVVGGEGEGVDYCVGLQGTNMKGGGKVICKLCDSTLATTLLEYGCYTNREIYIANDVKSKAVPVTGRGGLRVLRC
jgi:hypothetical protein